MRRALHTLFGLLGLALALAASPLLAKDHKGARHAAPQGQHQAPAQQSPAPAQPAPVAEPPAPKAEAPADPHAAEINAAFNDGLAVATKGPAKQALVEEADIELGPDQAFVPAREGLRILRALGNKPEAEGFVGLILGLKDSDSWIVVVRLAKEGYIKDDDAKNWSAAGLLDSIKEGTAETNKDRVERGFPEIEIIDWIEPPTYDARKHRLVWSLLSKEKGAPDSDAKGVNYNTYALGRDGFFSLNLLTDSNNVEKFKPVAKTLLSNLTYRPGKRYEDFNASTDKVAAYGLAALVGGVAAKKLGLFALAAGFFAKFAKLIFVAVAAIGAGVARFFKRGDKDAA